MASIAETLQLGWTYHQAGAIQQAEHQYRQVLQEKPDHPEALHLLSVLACQAGDHAAAIECLNQAVNCYPSDGRFHANLGAAYVARQQWHAAAASLGRAVELLPSSAEAYFNLGIVLKNLGNLDDAAASYRHALQIKPDFAKAHNNLGNLLLQQSRFDEAAQHFREAVRINPRHLDAFKNLAMTLHKQGKHDEAINALQHVLRQKPDLDEVHNDLGTVLQAHGKLDEATASYRQALRCNPHLAPTWLNLAKVLRIQEKLEEAVACCRQAVALQPRLAEAYSELGITLGEIGQAVEAVVALRQATVLRPDFVAAQNNLGNALRKLGKYEEAVGCYQEAIRLQPDCIDAHTNLARLYHDSQKGDAAVQVYRRALQLQPDLADAHAGLGGVYYDLGDVDQAEACMQAALRLKPNDQLRVGLATRLPILYQSMDELLSWRQRLVRGIQQLHEQHVVLDLTKHPPISLFYLAYQGFNDRDVLQSLTRLYKTPESASEPPPLSDPRKRKIRIGILSSLFRVHSVGFWMRGLVANLSRDDFVVTVLSVGNNEDEVANFVKQHADHFVAVPRQLSTARRMIAEQKCDVLMYADLGTDPLTKSLAYYRQAPVQCTTLGHPITSAIDAIDYYISTEDMETPESQEHYTETLIRLKTPPFYFYRPQLEGLRKKREDFGLTPRDHVYVCLQSLFKFHPEFDDFIGGILRGDPQGILLITRGTYSPAEQLLRRRFATTLPDVANRIRWMPVLAYREYLNVVALSDAMLDPRHFGGGTTTYEGLALGTPIVTMPSRLLRGRITYGHYKQMGVLDCVADTPEQYVEIALRLGTDRDFRNSMRQKILEANGVLYENSTGIRELEQFLRTAVESAGRHETPHGRLKQ